MYDFPALKYVLWLIYLIPMLFLVQVYRNRENDEPMLGLKLVGYYLLGCFTFRINNFGIPLGIIVYALFFRPPLNAASKKRAALVGLLVFAIFFVYYLLPETRRVERLVEVPASSANAFSMRWQEDQRQIANRLPDISSVNDFSLSFEPDGTIRELRATWTSSRGTFYQVSFNSASQQYAIRYSDEYPKDPAKPPNKPPVMFPNSQVPTEMLFAGLDRLRLREMLPEGKFDYYVVVAPQGIYHGKIKGSKDPSYLVKGSELTELKEGEEKELPSYYHLFIQGMIIQPPRATSDGSGTVVSHSSAAGRHYYIVP